MRWLRDLFSSWRRESDESHWVDLAKEAGLKAANEKFDELVERARSYREFKPCPSCRGTDILAGYSIKRGVEEVWCDECGYTVFAGDPWLAVSQWNSQTRNPESD